MTRSLLFLVLTLSVHNVSAQTVSWSAAVPVADPSFGSTRPHIAVCNGVPVAVWCQMETNKIFAARYTGGAFSAPVDVVPHFPAYTMDWMAPEIAAAGDTLFVVFGDAAMTKVYMVRSLNGGQTFGDTVRVDDGSNGVMPVEPSVDVMPGGNPVVNFIVSEADYTDARTLVVRSNDGGMTFSAPVDATAPVEGESCDCCKASMVIDGDRTVLLFRNNEHMVVGQDTLNIRDFYASISNDGGATFPQAVRVDFSNWNIASCPTSPPDAHIVNDTLVTVFMSAASGDNKVYRSSLDMNTLQQPTQQLLFNGGNASQNYPRMAAEGETMGVVWQQNTFNSSDIMFTHSFNGPDDLGASAIELGASINGLNGHPDVAFDGDFHVVFENADEERVYYTFGTIVTSTPAIETHNPILFDVLQADGKTCTVRFNANTNDVTLRLMSVNGQTVETQSLGDIAVNRIVTLNTAALSNGTYMITASDRNGGRKHTQRFVVNR